MNTSEEYRDIKSWDDIELKEEVLRGIYSYGLEKPSDIQKKAIIPMISGKDILAQSQSGSGKTGAFTISTLQLIDVTKHYTQALILVPTHELANQVTNVVKDIGRFMTGLHVKTLIGGTSVRDDIKSIHETPPHIIVGCTGRVYDIFENKCIHTTDIKLLVLDEADEMLSQGFGEQIKNMFQYFFHNTIQVALFSATMPPYVIKITDSFLQNPVRIIVNKEELSLQCITQYYVALRNDDAKYDSLKNLFSVISSSKCIIYCNSVQRVITLYEAMKRDGFSVCHIHSSMEKHRRYDVIQAFKLGDTRVLISSDITARGIDIQQVNTVINFDIPRCVNTYLHRIGRGGRWGRKGFAINFVTQQDVQNMRRIENHYKIQILELPENYNGTVH
jgi:translation initiation factor 4A